MQSVPTGRKAVLSEQISRLHSELDSICKPGVGLGQYDPEFNIEQLNIPDIMRQVRQAAPELWTLLSACMEAKRPTKPRESDPKFEGYLMMIYAILVYGRHTKTPPRIQTLLGLHLHSMGVKRRTINLLSGLGISSSYATVMTRVKEIATRGEVENDSVN